MEKFLLLILICLAFLLRFNLFPIQKKPEKHMFNNFENGCLLKCNNELRSPTNTNGSLCGLSPRTRGDHQKVVSFSFYGDAKNFHYRYYNGIKENLISIQYFYPKWIMRLYVDWTSRNDSTEDVCRIHCQNPDGFDICSVRNLNRTFGRIWRFLPLSDPTVDIMIVRDLDSRINNREVAAVSEWLSSGLPFHAMRDHPSHGTWILAGMWGARMDLGNREKYKKIMNDLIEKAGNGSKTSLGHDQDMLGEVVWPLVQNETMVHDSYTCQHWKSPHLRPFPTKREEGIDGNFVASGGPTAKGEQKQDCPEACRPVNHQDWTKC